MISFFQGLILGLIIVLPGMSGGTAFLILGLYDKVVKDFSRFHILPYLPLFGGGLIGIFLGGLFFAFLFAFTRDITSSFLLGALLASLRIVLQDRPRFSLQRLLILLAAVFLGLYLARDPLTLTDATMDINLPLLFTSGAVASATMLIPGISGSSILIIMGVYDEALFFLKELVFFKLLVLAAGGVTGFFLLARFMEKIYFNYKEPVSFFFAGLIIGSSKALLPYNWHPPVILAFLAGLALVWWWGGRCCS